MLTIECSDLLKRSTRNVTKPGTTASAAVKTPNTTSETINARLRPKLSASQPTVTLLTPMPSSVAVASRPLCVVVSPSSARMAGNVNDSSKISTASNM
nr:hypothetical protein [Lentzea indica]